MSQNGKDKNYWSILDTVIRLEVSKGHLAWKVTDLSRLSGVGRPLIYYYFGKSKKEIVETALKIIGDEFFGLSDERIQMWREGRILDSILKTRELLTKAPHVTEFYFHWRHQKGEICNHLKKLEQGYRRKLKEYKKDASDADIDAVFALLFGLILLPDLNKSSLEHAFDTILTFLSKK